MNNDMAANLADIHYAYELILGRDPDVKGLLHFTGRLLQEGLAKSQLRMEFLKSQEFGQSLADAAITGSPFLHYNASFDVRETVVRHAAKHLSAHPSYLTNFLGVRIDPKFFPSILTGRENQIEPPPIPSNWHADMAEWAAALRAVDLAGPKFVMAELGCGWGCWMNATGVAARNTGRDVHLIGVEGDAVHVGFANESLAANGFKADEMTLRWGVAAATAGIALFPQEDRDGQGWGAKPIFGATEEERDKALETGRYDVLPMISLPEIAHGHDRISLLHVDIQGGEADLVAGSLPTLNEKVRYLVVGTHSRALEGRLVDMLLSAGWVLEVERPGLLHLNGATPDMYVDGVQGWRNALLDLA